MMEYGEFVLPGFCGPPGIHLCLDGFRLIYVLMAVFMWAVSGVFSRKYMAHYEKKGRFYLFFWLTFLATLGVFLSADLYTTFIFFEIMSFTSYVWVAFDERKESLRAAETYLAVAVIGGLMMLMGLFLLYHLLGTLEMDKLHQAALKVADKRQLYLAGGLLLFGFGAKAGCFPLHIWLPKAHPVAPAPASALLSGILTKSGIFGIIVISCQIFTADIFAGDGSWGFLIAVLGTITMFWGAFLALFSIDLKKTLACSSVSQIGFILVGIGMYGLLSAAGENPSIAARGTFLHMVNHSLFKLVLFLCAGAVFMKLHQLDLNEIRGFGRKKPVLKFCFLMGALGITGVPFWSGYVSKTLLHEGIVEYQMILAEQNMPSELLSGSAAGIMAWIGNPAVWKAAEWIFLLSGGITAAYMLKLFVAVFVEKNPKRQSEFDAMKMSGTAVILIPAVFLPVLGSLPSVTMDRLADLGQSFFRAEEMEHAVDYFSMVNLKGSLISLFIGLILYFVLVRGLLMKENRYEDRLPRWFDLENSVYRPILQVFLPNLFGLLCRILDSLTDGLILLARKTTHRQLKEKVYVNEENKAAVIIGGFIDGWHLLLFKFRGGSKKGLKAPKSCIPELKQEERLFLLVGKMVDESFSFGLLLFTIGLCATLGYLLFAFLV
ncbi:MAG: proton-conducting transporter membrane subunit [Lachnospiraceae bacterium]|nr:proton-conducting transporter membrane subunit [Lachnospiraceae bacterium]